MIYLPPLPPEWVGWAGGMGNPFATGPDESSGRGHPPNPLTARAQGAYDRIAARNAAWNQMTGRSAALDELGALQGTRHFGYGLPDISRHYLSPQRAMDLVRQARQGQFTAGSYGGFSSPYADASVPWQMDPRTQAAYDALNTLQSDWAGVREARAAKQAARGTPEFDQAMQLFRQERRSARQNERRGMTAAERAASGR